VRYWAASLSLLRLLLYGGVLIDPVTAPMMPNQDRITGIPLNSFVFGLAWVLLSGAALTTGATRTSVDV
jgi:hypothetical protein